MERPALLNRSRGEQLALVLAGLALQASLALLASYAASGTSTASPERASKDSGSVPWEVVEIAGVFVAWPGLGSLGILRRKGVLVAIASVGYLAHAFAMVSSLGGPHLISGLPLLLVGSGLYGWSRTRSTAGTTHQ